MFQPAALLLGILAAPPPLTLDEAVRRAVIRNTSALVAQQEIARAEGILKEARAPSLPTLSLNAVGTQLDAARRSASTLAQGQTSLNANATLLFPILAPQRWVAWAHASDQLTIARTSAEDVQRGV